jgi:hypothetical protein
VQLNIPERLLMTLLESSLKGKAPELAFKHISDKDWKECAQLAKRQGVLALAWDGVQKLPQELQPYKGLRISWALAVEDYENTYRRYCRAVDELSSFYKEHGVALVQLKGVGLSTYYPVPEHREGGDIDIYAFSADRNRLTDSQANVLADSLMEAKGIEVDHSHAKHSHFIYDGIPVENHVTFIDADRCPLTEEVEALLHRHLDPQEVELPSGERINIPSDRFNLMFVGYHAISHYGSGLCLHHLFDWASLLVRCGYDLPESIKEPHFMKGLDAMTGLCNEFLGTDVPVKANKKIMSDMLEDILHPLDYRYLPDTGTWDVLKYKMRRFRHSIRSQHRFLHTPILKNEKLWTKVIRSIQWHLTHSMTE